MPPSTDRSPALPDRSGRGNNSQEAPCAVQGLCRARWTQYKSNPSRRNSDATLRAKVSVSFEKVLFAHDPISISFTSFERDTAFRV